MPRSSASRILGRVVLLGLGLFSAVLLVPVAYAQPPANNPNEMCGDGTTFTVNLPGLNVLPGGAKAPDDSITLPNGCDIYALLVSGYEQNPDLDMLTFYKLAKFVAERNGYVHYAWWNNIMKEYMAGPAHNVSVTIPLLGTFQANPGGLIGVHGVGFAPLDFTAATTLFPKAIPEEDTQFQADAKLLLQAIRAHNPDAAIIVAGHSMGGEAVARLGTDTNVVIDLLAPIDPVGNRTRPVGIPGHYAYNWTRWRAARSVWPGYRQADCIRVGPFPLPCRDFDSRPFRVQYRCEPQGVGPLLDSPPVIKSRAPAICPGPWVHPGQRRTIKSNVRHLLHRWQKENLFPFDFNTNEPFIYQGTDTVTTSGMVVAAQEGLGENGPLESDPQKTCANPLSNDPRDPALKCSAIDGHGEIVGMRGVDTTGPIPVGHRAQNWPTDAAGRRQKLIEMATAPGVDLLRVSTEDPAWPHEPKNPNLCMVSDDMIRIVQTILDQRGIGSAPADTTAPVSVASLTPGANPAGWHNEDVSVSISAADEPGGSGVKQIEHSLTGAQFSTMVTASDTAVETITAEGTTTVLFRATDNADNVEPQKSLDIRIDKTPPAIGASTSPPPNLNEWNNTNVLVSFPASDEAGGSGLATSSADVLVSTEGASQEVTGTAEDNAGNQAAASAILNIDKTAPGIALASRTPAANSAGWNNTDVNFTWDCTDALSGVASPSVTQSLTSEGAAQMVIGTCADMAGNTASDTQAGINIDKTAPAIQGSPSPGPNANGWNNSDVAVSFTCSDPLSGLAAGSPPANAVLTTHGAGQSVTESCSDIAGNSASATVSDINLDKTAPTAAGTPDRAPDVNDWYNHMLTVAWNGTDALSGIASCSAASNYAGPDSASASVNGACTDQAGNSTGAIVSFQFDATKPAINIASPSSGAAYLLNAAVNADYGCADTASGVQSCSGPVASGAAVNTAAVGAKQFTVNSRDVAGNTALATRNYSVHYAFSGFANPIGPMPMVNVVNAGRTVPVKYYLQDVSGAFISDLGSFVSLMSGPMACDSSAPGVLAEETDAAGSTAIRYDATANQFVYNWKTDNSWAGTCRALQLTLSDGTQHWAMFQFK